jgi:cellulose synthase operon protein C
MAAIARDVPDERDAAELRTWGWATLIGDAGRRGDWPAALALFEEEFAAAPAGCLVAASSDDERSVALVRGPDGAVRGAYQTDRRIGAVDAATIVPRDLLAPLAPCRSIAVIARPPLHGATALLPPELPWAFVGPTRAAASKTDAHAVIVDDARPPASLALPALRPATTPPGALRVTGSAATPSRVRAALADATYVELHAHGIVDAAQSETSFLALSPDPDGDYALTAATVRATSMRGAPVVVLAACRTATVAPSLHRRWSLPDAFLAAGARAVIATTDAVPDDEVGPWLADLRARLDRGETPAAAVAALRARALADGKAWAAGWLVFE